MYDTDLTFERAYYRREKYVCWLHIRRDRLVWDRRGDYVLKDPKRVADVMTRWLRRCLYDQPAVMGRATVAVRDWWREPPAIGAVVNVYLDVRPEHVDLLRDMVDKPRAQAVEVMVPTKVNLDAHLR